MRDLAGQLVDCLGEQVSMGIVAVCRGAVDVGWVERSETRHGKRIALDKPGFAALNPAYELMRDLAGNS